MSPVPLSSYGDVLAALGVEMASTTSALAVLLIDIPDVSSFQAGLGFSASASLLHELFNGFVHAVGERGRILRLSDGRVCAIVRAVRNGGHAMLAAEKLARTAEDLLAGASIAIKPQLNIGISMYPSHATDAEPLLRLAQLATEASRKRGARFVIYDPRCDSEVLTHWDLGNAYAQALDGGELSVYFQPKVSMSTGRPVGVESLTRWLRDGAAVASPDVFIALATEAGLIQTTTWYCLSNSLRMSQELGHLPVAVNITPQMLHHREFIDMMKTAISTWAVKHGDLTLEITEGALIADFAQAAARLKGLRDMGIRVSIDDFGTGYSSLSYFKKIPADEIKIDKSFVLGMANDPADQKLVQTIISLAAHFNLNTVAEGVEDSRTFDMLASMGCHHAQGFLFSPALNPERLKEWLAKHSRNRRFATDA